MLFSHKKTIPLVFDAHVHFRVPPLTELIVSEFECYCQHVIIMPNTKTPHLTNGNRAARYRNAINQMISSGSRLNPLVTLYITRHTTVEDLRQAYAMGVKWVKFYPGNTTTGSDLGLENFATNHHIHREMEKLGMYGLFHCEKPKTHEKDAEAEAIEQVRWISEKFCYPISIEHVSTEQMIKFVHDAHSYVTCTITPQHTVYTYKDARGQESDEHKYCMPVYKNESDRQAIIEFMLSGNPKARMGSDFAPHPVSAKVQGAAGVCIPPSVYIPMFAKHFIEADKVKLLEHFLTYNSAKFFDLSVSKKRLTLEEKCWQIPEKTCGDCVIANRGESLEWQVKPE